MSVLSPSLNVFVVVAQFYPDISDLQFKSVESFFEKHDFKIDKVTVPGCFEIPGAISIASASKTKNYDMYIALGCLIKGETSHYDLICTAATNALMDLTINKSLPLGFGILTCNNQEQAKKRASSSAENAVKAALSIFKFQEKLLRESNL